MGDLEGRESRNQRHFFKRQNRRFHDGTALTSHKIGDLLPQVLGKIGGAFSARPDLILAVWPEIVGPKFAKQTEAVSFVEGVLQVKVKSSTLLQLLVQYEKGRILERLRYKFPKVEIKTVIFRIG